MHYVYILQSRKSKKFYFGMTHNIVQRLSAHNSYKVDATKHGVPWVVVYLEGYRSEKDAHVREHMLKHYGNARTHIKKRAINSLL